MMKPTVVIVVSMRFSAMILTTFLERTKPASSKPNPACMKKTRKAANSTQTVSTALTTVSLSWAKAVLLEKMNRAAISATLIKRRHLRIFFFHDLLSFSEPNNKKDASA